MTRFNIRRKMFSPEESLAGGVLLASVALAVAFVILVIVCPTTDGRQSVPRSSVDLGTNPLVEAKELLWEIGGQSDTADSISRFFDAHAVPAECDAAGNCMALRRMERGRFFYAMAISSNGCIADYDLQGRVLWIYPSNASRQERAIALCKAVADARDHVTASYYGDVVASIERELNRNKNGSPAAIAASISN